MSIIPDIYDDSIVSYKTGTEQGVGLVLQTIKEAKQKEKVTAEVQLHSDQGFQYTSNTYFNLMKEYNITPSMSRRGNPYDNAMAENFFYILKTQCVYHCKLNTIAEAKALIDEFICFYNNERIELKTKLTPLERRCQFNNSSLIPSGSPFLYCLYNLVHDVFRRGKYFSWNYSKNKWRGKNIL